MPHDPSAPAPPAQPVSASRRLGVGLALLLAAAVFFSLHNTLARLAYDEGVGPTTVNAVRTWTVLLLFVVAFGAKGQWPRVPRAAWLAFAITTVCYSLHNPLLLVAFQFIPVSLAVLVMYVYPLLVAFMAAAVGLERVRATTCAAAAVAFVGVALVLEVGDARLDWRGIALAAIAAFALSGNLVGAAQLNRHMAALAVPFALSTVGAVVFGGLMVASGGPTLPSSAHGWLIFAAAILTSPAALIAFYLALPRAGPGRSALLMNIEPISTVAFAAWLLGESLNWGQGLGAVLIIGAVGFAILVRLRGRRV